jgi:HPt (histidine-containing phosphotransfer) domain-containing protein
MSEVDALLAEARADYASRLPEKLASLEALAARGAWDEARRAAHKLRGSAATYGFVAIGEAAATLEELLREASSDPGRGASLLRDSSIEEALLRARVEVERLGGSS